MEVVEPSALSPDQGTFEVDVDISPSCNLKLDDRRLTEQGLQISQQLQRFVVTSQSLDLSALCIIPGKYCWNIAVDLLILAMDDGGNPLDACSIAMYVALNCTKLPKIELFVGESGSYEDFEVFGDLGEATSLNASNVPICISSSKIGTVLVLDTTGSEQACASCIFTIAIDKVGTCCGLIKSLGGHFIPLDVATAQIHATTAAAAIFGWIDTCFTMTTTSSINDRLYPDIPPNRFGLLA